jgi:NAD(P)-dependent dehydrogenase (short-subunit alcohol dehydrogenase family)
MTMGSEQSMSNLLEGKHAVVTGGARGIGAAVTRVLLTHGARVTVLGRSEYVDLSSRLHLEKSRKVDYASADVSDPDAVDEAFASAKGRWGPVSILVNNAGRAMSSPFLKTDVKLWRVMMDVNLDGTFHSTHAALPDMLEAGWGRIVNIASTAGLVGYGYVSAYCAAKHGVIGLTRALALEVATKGVTVNAVCPGYTETDMLLQAVNTIATKTGRTPEDARAELVSHNPQKKLIQPQEVANAVAWLCLPGSDAITGQAVSVSGGEVM